jgi:hypothetical protein
MRRPDVADPMLLATAVVWSANLAVTDVWSVE